jgi:hypothetical protein
VPGGGCDALGRHHNRPKVSVLNRHILLIGEHRARPLMLLRNPWLRPPRCLLPPWRTQLLPVVVLLLVAVVVVVVLLLLLVPGPGRCQPGPRVAAGTHTTPAPASLAHLGSIGGAAESAQLRDISMRS